MGVLATNSMCIGAWGAVVATVSAAVFSAPLPSASPFFSPAVSCCGDAWSGEPMRGPETIRNAPPPSLLTVVLSEDEVVISAEGDSGSSRSGVAGAAAMTEAVSSD